MEYNGMISAFHDAVPTDTNTDDMEKRVLIIDRSGSGNVYFLLVADNETINQQNIDFFGETWPELQYIKDYSVCGHGEYVYIVGGFDLRTKTHLSTAKRYHSVLDIWEHLPNMFHARSNSAAVYCNGKIYVTGGEMSAKKCTKSCEAFNLTAWCWERVGMLPAARKNHRAVTDGNTVFISGGEGVGKLHASVWLSEDYSWNKMDTDYPTIMSRCRSRHVMALHEGTLYFVGGVTSPMITSLDIHGVNDTTNPTLVTNNKASHSESSSQTTTSVTSKGFTIDSGHTKSLAQNKSKALNNKKSIAQSTNSKHRQHIDENKVPFQNQLSLIPEIPKQNGTTRKHNTVPIQEETSPHSLAENTQNLSHNQHSQIDDDALSSQSETNTHNFKQPELNTSTSLDVMGNMKQPQSNTNNETSLEISNCMESFMPIVVSTVEDEHNFISPWDWGLPTMKCPRMSAGAVILDSQLYIIGGTSKDGQPVTRVEKFDFKTKEWTSHCGLSNCNISNVACLVVQCGKNRRTNDKTPQLDPWTKYRWVMW